MVKRRKLSAVRAEETMMSDLIPINDAAKADVLTLDEVAAKLKVSRESARRLCTSGKLPYIEVGTGSSRALRRVRREALAEFLANERKQAVRQQVSDVRRQQTVLKLVEQRW